jgi:hypothetical protein
LCDADGAGRLRICRFLPSVLALPGIRERRPLAAGQVIACWVSRAVILIRL